MNCPTSDDLPEQVPPLESTSPTAARRTTRFERLLSPGCLLFSLLAVLMLLVLPKLTYRHRPGSECRRNLSLLRRACLLYREKHGSDPPNLRAVYEAGDMEPIWFVCPHTGDRRHVVDAKSWNEIERHVTYEYRAVTELPHDRVNPDYLIAWEKTPHSDGAYSVLFHDGTWCVRSLDAKELREALGTAP